MCLDIVFFFVFLLGRGVVEYGEDELCSVRIVRVEIDVATQCPCNEAAGIESQSESWTVVVDFLEVLEDDFRFLWWHWR